GGADLVAIPADYNTTVSAVPIDDLAVVTNLWSFTGASIDGSGDLKIEYNCGGGPCLNGSLIGLHLQTSDVASTIAPDAGAESLQEFDYQIPATEFGLMLCLDILPVNSNSFTIKKETLQGTFPTSWKTLFVGVSVINSKQGATPDNQNVTVAA